MSFRLRFWRKPKELVYLHVGMHKTGTTSIQRSLQGYDDKKIRYADLGLSNHSVFIKTIFGRLADEYEVHKAVGRDKKDVEALSAQYRKQLISELKSRSRTLVISGEDIGILSSDEVADVRDFLLQYSDSVRVVGYVREPYGYASSMFQQDVKTGLSELETRAPRYRFKFEKFLKVFGEENCEIVRFEPRAFPGKCAVNDFCRRLGVDTRLIDRVRENDGLPAEVVALMYFWNMDGVRSVGEARLMRTRMKMVAALRLHFSQKFSLDPDLVEEKLDADDVRWMENILGEKFARNAGPKKAGGDKVQVGSIAELVDLQETCGPLSHPIAGEDGYYY